MKRKINKRRIREACRRREIILALLSLEILRLDEEASWRFFVATPKIMAAVCAGGGREIDGASACGDEK